MEEVWKDIQNYEGLYQISNLGRVKSLRYNIFMKTSLTPNGYYKVSLSKNAKSKTYNIHRILGISFIPNPGNKSELDHIDRNKTNNNLSNLRWVDRSDNIINRELHYNEYCNIQTICNNNNIYYRVKIKRNGIRIIDKTFTVLEEAIRYRNDCLTTILDE
jgi:hypothetical protein